MRSSRIFSDWICLNSGASSGSSSTFGDLGFQDPRDSTLDHLGSDLRHGLVRDLRELAGDQRLAHQPDGDAGSDAEREVDPLLLRLGLRLRLCDNHRVVVVTPLVHTVHVREVGADIGDALLRGDEVLIEVRLPRSQPLTDRLDRLQGHRQLGLRLRRITLHGERRRVSPDSLGRRRVREPLGRGDPRLRSSVEQRLDGTIARRLLERKQQLWRQRRRSAANPGAELTDFGSGRGDRSVL